MKTDFKIGDVVVLNSGGPRMTITDIIGDGKVNCMWFNYDDKTHVNIGSFNIGTFGFPRKR